MRIGPPWGLASGMPLACPPGCHASASDHDLSRAALGRFWLPPSVLYPPHLKFLKYFVPFVSNFYMICVDLGWVLRGGLKGVLGRVFTFLLKITILLKISFSLKEN